MSTFTQLFPPPPSFTEKNLLDLSSKVYIITGATSGIGLALAKFLYNLHATVYIGASSTYLFTTATEEIKKECPDSRGAIKPFIADLSAPATIKPAVESFQKEEYRLDVLFLNPPEMTPPTDRKTPDATDPALTTTCLSPFLLTTLLHRLMTRVSTHFCHPNTSIRVIWVSSLLTLSAPAGGVQLEPSPSGHPWGPKQLSGMEQYMQSKAGVFLLANEFARRQILPQKDEHGITTRNPAGVLHVCVNPGFMNTELQRHIPLPMRGLLGAMVKRPKYGAYTELYAGLAPDVSNGDFVIPWGRKGCVPEHIHASTLEKAGERSTSARFYEWCDEMVRPFM